MALVRASGKCFAAFNEAVEAVNKNDAKRAAIILQSVKQDGMLLQTEARRLHHQLGLVEQKEQIRVEDLTRKINTLYNKEKQLKQEERDLGVRVSKLQARREHHEESRRDAQKRRERARTKQRQAEEKIDEFKTWWWVPIYGQVLTVRELMEDNRRRANDAEREKRSHERDVQDADKKIRSTNFTIHQVHKNINDLREKVRKLKEERDRINGAREECRRMQVIVLEAISFSKELVNLAGDAWRKTGYLERIMALAAKQNITKDKSRGMKRAVSSFEDSWMKVVQLVSENQIIILDNRLTNNIFLDRLTIGITIIVMIIVQYLQWKYS